MKRFYGMLLATALVPAVALAAEGDQFSKVEVKAELEEVQANALDFWPNMTADIEAAVKDKLSSQWTEDGQEIEVNIKQVSMNGSQLLTGDGEFNHLEGWVYLFPDDMREKTDQVKITIDATTAPVNVTPDTVAVVLPSDADFYKALVDAFAEKTAEQVNKM